ncbi:MAG: hypothetical protein OEZ01_16530, partial [Candidatus Heimdallarchaeota archaeon]|nr:hypothetical protein [Candidatus Heimdallarchaeota archaeon]
MDLPDNILALSTSFNYTSYTLNKRKEYPKCMVAFSKALLNQKSAEEIMYHGLNGLYRGTECLKNPELDFHELNLPRRDGNAIDELLELYKEQIDNFSSLCRSFSREDLDKQV